MQEKRPAVTAGGGVELDRQEVLPESYIKTRSPAFLAAGGGGLSLDSCEGTARLMGDEMSDWTRAMADSLGLMVLKRGGTVVVLRSRFRRR